MTSEDASAIAEPVPPATAAGLWVELEVRVYAMDVLRLVGEFVPDEPLAEGEHTSEKRGRVRDLSFLGCFDEGGELAAAWKVVEWDLAGRKEQFSNTTDLGG